MDKPSAFDVYTNSAAVNASMIGKALHVDPLSNPMLRRWNCRVNGVLSHMPHDAHYIEFEGEFSEQTRKLFVEAVKYCHRSASTPVIMIRINSYGGNIYSLLPMLDALESVRLSDKNPDGKKIYTICSSHVMSCGAVLFSAGDVRVFNGDMAEMMVHPARVWVEGSQTNPAMRSKAAQMDTLNNDLFAYMSKQFNINMERWLREKGNNYELHIRPDVASNPEAHWDGQNFWIDSTKKIPMAVSSKTDGVPVLDFKFAVSADLNISVTEERMEAASAELHVSSARKGQTVHAVVDGGAGGELNSMIAASGALKLSWDSEVV